MIAARRLGPGGAMPSYRYIEVRPLAGALGAEVVGVDMARELEDDVVKEVRQAFLDHLVIFLRDQKVTPQQQVAFARRFGEPMEYPQLRGLPEAPLITPVVKLEHERNNFGGIWHSDTTYLAEPPMGSMLLALEVPPYGGDTMFANQYLAYEALSDGLKDALEGLIGVSTSAKAEVSKTAEDRMNAAGAVRKALTAEHPLVRTHPETGRKALYTSDAHTASIRGWTEKESLPLLQFLWEHQVKSEFTCRFRWQPGSLAFWDNRAALHNPINDYHGYRRVMHRITLAGDKPY
jgi:taurine dioxygenase